MKNVNIPGAAWAAIFSALTLLVTTNLPIDDPWVPIILGGLALLAKVVTIVTGTDIPAGVVEAAPGPEGTLATPAPVQKPNPVLRALFG